MAAYACGWCSYFGNVGGTAAFARYIRTDRQNKNIKNFTFSGFASIINAAVQLGSTAGNSTTGLNDVPNQLSLDNRIQAAIAIGIIVIWTLQNALKIDQQGQAEY